MNAPLRKQSRGETTALRALACALALYETEGRDGFTINRIAAESGISVGSLYHHFGSFDGLAASLYAFCMGELLDSLVIAVEKTKTAKQGIVAITRGYLLFTKKNAGLMRFIHASAYADFIPAHAALVNETKAQPIARLFAWLRPHVKAGDIIELPPALFEMLVIGPVAETARRWLAGTKEIDLNEAAELLPERIWQSVRRVRS